MHIGSSLLIVACSLHALADQATTPLAASPLQVTLPREKAADFKELPEGAILRIGSSLMPSAVEVNFSFSADGKYLTYAKRNRSAEVREVKTGRVIHRFGPFPFIPYGAFVAPDGKTVAVPAGDSCYLYDMTTGKETAKLRNGGVFGGDYVVAVSFSADGKLVCTGTSFQTVAVWDRQTGEQLHRFFNGFQMGVYHVAISADSSMVAGADIRGNIRAWTLPAGQPGVDFPAIKAAQALRFEDDGKSLMAVSGDDGLHRWDVATGRELEARPEIKGGSSAMNVGTAISPDGKLLVTFRGDGPPGPIVFWDRKSGKAIGKITDKIICSAAISPDNRTLATYGADGLMRLWDIPSGNEINPPQGHQHHVTGVAFSNDGKTFFSSSEDGTVRFWDRASGQEMKRLAVSGECFQALAVAGDGKTLVLAGSNFHQLGDPDVAENRRSSILRFWDVVNDEETKNLVINEGTTLRLRFTADNRRVLARHKTVVQIINAKTGETKNPNPKLDDYTLSADISPDGRYLASIKMIEPVSCNCRITCLDLISGKEVNISTSVGTYYDTAFSPDGKNLAGYAHFPNTNREKTGLHLWSVLDGKVVREFDTVHPLSNLTFSRDGRLLAGTDGERVVVFEVSTGKIRRTFTGHENQIRSLAFSHDGRELVSGGEDCRILVWDNTGHYGKKAAAKLDVKEANLLWEKLLSDDAAGANDALWSLVEHPQESLSYFKNELDLVSQKDLQRLEMLITDLDDDRFAIRRRAASELEKQSDAAIPFLKKAVGSKSPEVSEAAKKLLEKIGTGEDPATSPNARRLVRTIEVLEHVGTAEAKSLLKELKERGRAAIVQHEAAAALERLK